MMFKNIDKYYNQFPIDIFHYTFTEKLYFDTLCLRLI